MPRSAYSKGANKALRAMRKRYGTKRGTSIFYAKSNKYGKGKSRPSRANSVYAKGSHRVRRRRRGRRKKR